MHISCGYEQTDYVRSYNGDNLGKIENQRYLFNFYILLSHMVSISVEAENVTFIIEYVNQL